MHTLRHTHIYTHAHTTHTHTHNTIYILVLLIIVGFMIIIFYIAYSIFTIFTHHATTLKYSACTSDISWFEVKLKY